MEIIFVLLIPVGVYMFVRYFLSIGEGLRSSSPLPAPDNVPKGGWGCKDCLSEYERDVTICADCGADLVDFSAVPNFVIGEKRKKELDELEKKYSNELKDIRKRELDLKFGKTKSKKKKRKPIPQHVQDKVWRRDEGKCVSCGSNENLEFDHIIPHSKGGSDTYRNLQLLCESCNRSKSNKIG